MTLNPNGSYEERDYDVRTMSVVAAGGSVEDIAQAGWDSSKDHEMVYTPDNKVIRVHSSPETSLTIAVHNTSPTIPAFRAAYASEESFAATFNAPDDAGYDVEAFLFCAVDSLDPGDEEDSNMPDYTVEITAGDMR